MFREAVSGDESIVKETKPFHSRNFQSFNHSILINLLFNSLSYLISFLRTLIKTLIKLGNEEQNLKAKQLLGSFNYLFG